MLGRRHCDRSRCRWGISMPSAPGRRDAVGAIPRPSSRRLQPQPVLRPLRRRMASRRHRDHAEDLRRGREAVHGLRGGTSYGRILPFPVRTRHHGSWLAPIRTPVEYLQLTALRRRCSQEATDGPSFAQQLRTRERPPLKLLTVMHAEALARPGDRSEPGSPAANPNPFKEHTRARPLGALAPAPTERVGEEGLVKGVDQLKILQTGRTLSLKAGRPPHYVDLWSDNLDRLPRGARSRSSRRIRWTLLHEWECPAPDQTFDG
jgi:hypothetical protein